MTYCSKSRPWPPPQVPEQFLATQDPTQFLGGQGTLLTHGVVERVLPPLQGQLAPPHDLGTAGQGGKRSKGTSSNNGIERKGFSKSNGRSCSTTTLHEHRLCTV